jgi:hypothetical protein
LPERARRERIRSGSGRRLHPGPIRHGRSWHEELDTAYWGSLGAAATATGGPQHYWLTLGKSYQFSDGGAIALGQWTDFVMMIDWSTGAIALWRRDQAQTAFSQVVSAVEASVPTVTGVYLKQGLYRGGYVKGRSDVFWMGPTVRGGTFAAVEQLAFGTNSGP